MKTKLAKKASDISSTQSRLSSKSISSSIADKAKSLKNAVAKGAKALGHPLKKVKQSFASRSARLKPTDTVDLTRSSTDLLASDNDKAAAGASDPDPAADLGNDIDALQKTWRSPIYGFFSADVTVSEIRTKTAAPWKARPPCFTFKASTYQNLPSKIYSRYHKGVGYIVFYHWDIIQIDCLPACVALVLEWYSSLVFFDCSFAQPFGPKFAFR
ncbi:hypothetical protein BDR07DRAFT_1488099 [Suillus spraguei]|nr:hypothetical protein BDR07DRAFT_1488099 [Suillus spraguei]